MSIVSFPDADVDLTDELSLAETDKGTPSSTRFDSFRFSKGPPSAEALQHRYELLQRDVLAREAKKQHLRHRAAEDDVHKFFRNGTLTSQLLTEEAGIALGKIREIARNSQSAPLESAVRDLHRALEEQLMLFYLERHDNIVEPIKPYLESSLVASAVHLNTTAAASTGTAANANSAVVAATSVPPAQPKHRAVATGSAQLRRSKAKTLTLEEGLSAAIALHAESLAVMLRCEQVRIYLVDGNKSLQLAAQFPFGPQGIDPMSGDYTTKALAKALFTSVIEKALAVSGVESRPSLLQGESSMPIISPANRSNDSSRKKEDDDLSQIRTCLAWPIVCPSGVNRVVGLVHAVNKEGATAEQSRRFSADDEMTMHIACRTLGCILERYPAELFAKPVGSQIHQLCHPDGNIIPHLPDKILSEVDGAQRVANESVRVEPARIIYRGPMTAIFKQSARDRRNEEFKTSTFGTLSGVEYNLEALKDLWRVGYDENVSMHMQCRILSTKVRDLKVIVKSMVDGLCTARAIISPQDLRMYLRELELSLRAENAEQITLRIESAMEQVIKGSLPKEQAAIVTSDIIADRLKQRKKEAEAAISSIHVDGPQTVRSYTCDPVTKLLQVRAISELMEKNSKEEEKKIDSSAPDHLVPRFATKTMSSTLHAQPKKVYSEDEDRNVCVMQFKHTRVDAPTPFRLQAVKPHPPSVAESSKKAQRPTSGETSTT